jgi:hypothetical protein
MFEVIVGGVLTLFGILLGWLYSMITENRKNLRAHEVQCSKRHISYAKVLASVESKIEQALNKIVAGEGTDRFLVKAIGEIKTSIALLQQGKRDKEGL